MDFLPWASGNSKLGFENDTESKDSHLKFCAECGGSAGDAQKSCSECGTSLGNPDLANKIIPSGGGTSAESERPPHRDCESCKTPIEEGAAYCFECGLPVNKSSSVLKPEPMPIVPPGSGISSASGEAGAGLLGAMWGGSAGCGCGCFSLILLGVIVLAGALL